MTYSSFLDNNQTPLVLDTSVLINLHASTYGSNILGSVPNDILVPEIVAKELEHETSRNNGEHKFIQELVDSRKISLIELNENEYNLFANLVSGCPSLDDGEAATIASAVSRRCIPVIDERKGRLKAQKLMPEAQLGWSLDLFRQPNVIAELGSVISTEALYFALRDGRMRIHEDYCEFVVNLIGFQRAIECSCLPGYKVRLQKWQKQSSLSPSMYDDFC